MGTRFLAFLLIAVVAIVTVKCNLEVDVLIAWKNQLVDPNNVLQSWDPTLANPCTWFHVTCNSYNSTIRVDLGQAGLSGPLVPELGQLSNLQYLEVYGNNITGSIPTELGNLTRLIDLGLQKNQISGVIPSSLGNLLSLRFMRLNSNNLSGSVPIEVLQLVTQGNLQLLNISDNAFAGRYRKANSTTGFVETSIIQDPSTRVVGGQE